MSTQLDSNVSTTYSAGKHPIGQLISALIARQGPEYCFHSFSSKVMGNGHRRLFSEVVLDEDEKTSMVQSIAKRRRPLADITNNTSTKKSPGQKCIVCHITRVTYSGMCCKKCSNQTGLPTDPDGRLKRNNARHNPINNPINSQKVRIYSNIFAFAMKGGDFLLLSYALFY